MPNFSDGSGGGGVPASAIITAGAALGSAAINAHANSVANQASEDFQWKMYDRQRSDALADWQRNNDYNSPLQQMTRFKLAGLNPNLIYGNQSSQAAPVRSSSGANIDRKVPQFDFAGIVQGFLQTMMMEKQLTLQEKQMELRDKEIALKTVGYDLAKAKAAGQSTLNAINETKLGTMSLTQGTDIATKEAKLKQLEIANEQAPKKLAIQQALADSTMQVNVQRVLLAEQQRLESQSRVTVNDARKQQIAEQIENYKAARRYVMLRGDVTEKDLNWYETNKVANIVTKAIGTVKGTQAMPSTSKRAFNH